MNSSQISLLARFYIGTGILALFAPLSFTLERGEVQWLLLDRPALVVISYAVALACAAGTLHEVLRQSPKI